VGTTSAGLTCAAVRDGKDFVLEAGALVLADRGVCCIDEFGCIKDDDRTTIHEAMEQQTLSVAKGGIVCKLSCRTTIIAACNPKGGPHELHDSLSKYTGLGMPLLSRFDLVFRLVDSSDVERDSKIAAHLLNNAIQGSDFLYSTKSKNFKETEFWNMEKLRAYIATVKSQFKPRISPSAAKMLQAHYQACRMNQSSTVQVTVRLFEALIRLSQAHARLMFRNIVTLQDAVAVILLMECSAWSVGGFNASDIEAPFNQDPMDDFPNDLDCDELFMQEQKALLSRYGLTDEVSEF
jgi:DNA helicase MCM9